MMHPQRIGLFTAIMALGWIGFFPAVAISSPIPYPNQPQFPWAVTPKKPGNYAPRMLLSHSCISKKIEKACRVGFFCNEMTCSDGAWCFTPAEFPAVSYAHCTIPDAVEKICSSEKKSSTTATFGKKSMVVAENNCADGTTCVLGECVAAGAAVCKDFDHTNVAALTAILNVPSQLQKEASIKMPSHVEVQTAGAAGAPDWYDDHCDAKTKTLEEMACENNAVTTIAVACGSIPGAGCVYNADGVAYCDIPDADGDGIADSLDNCTNTPNPGQVASEACLGKAYDDLAKLCDPDGDGDISDKFTDPLFRHLVWLNAFYKAKGQSLPAEVDDSKGLPISVFMALQLTSLEDFSPTPFNNNPIVDWPTKYENYYAGLKNLDGISCLRNLENIHLARPHALDPAQLSALAFLPLKKLWLQGAGIFFNYKPLSLDVFKSLATLEELQVKQMTVTDVAGINNHKQLSKLVLTDASLDDAKMSALTALPNVETIDLSSNNLTSLAFLAGMPKVKELLVPNNLQLTDMTAVQKLPALQKLCVDHSRIASLDALKDLTQLTQLYAAKAGFCDQPQIAACIKDLTPLAKLPLVEVDLNYNDVMELSPLAGAQATLQKLYVDNNLGLQDLTPLTTMSQLSVLNVISDMKITDLTPLLSNPGIGTGDDFSFSSNNIPLTQQDALKAKGVFLHFGDTQRLCGKIFQ